MENSQLEVLSSEIGSLRVGRRVYSESERLSYIRRYECSGLKQADYAAREGLVYTTFLGWLRRHRKQDRESNIPMRFAEVRMTGPVASQASVSRNGSERILEVCFPDGLVLRGSDASSLSVLYHGLKGVVQ